MDECEIKNIEKKVINILSEYFNVSSENIKSSSRLIEDLSIDSMSLVELIFELKEKFGLEIKKEDIIKIKTIKDVIDFIEAHSK
ncbi:MAG: acyl carrier protein [Candidatus Omnitrophota bacterium]|jgi:acyl carrier protein